MRIVKREAAELRQLVKDHPYGALAEALRVYADSINKGRPPRQDSAWRDDHLVAMAAVVDALADW